MAPWEGSDLLASTAIVIEVNDQIPQPAATEPILSRIRTSLRQESLFDEERHNRNQRRIEMALAPISIFDENGDTIWAITAVLELLGLDTRAKLPADTR
ncbi:hypothetical protein ACFQL3_00215 [Natronoarchaeum sp. GCM10025321]|uniref:hypothetical protein n=1 Tax=Natronoarchaeum sp. GCM10025321 TaxID=3252684 RepID=UPI003607068D